MTSITTALPYHWLILASVVALASLALSLHLVRQQLASSSRRGTVALLNILGHACILLLLTDPQLPSDTSARTTLVTDSETSGNALAPGYLAPWVEADRAKDLKRVPGVAALPFLAPETTELRIVGAGLTRDDWRHIPDNWRVSSALEAEADGLVAVNWARQVNIGEEWVLSGRLFMSESASTDIFTASLRDPAGREVASQKIRPGDRFVLPARTGINGPILYSLHLTDRDGTLRYSEPVPVAVRTPRPARLLVVQSAPSFETRHMSNWANTYGAELFIHTRVSKGRYIVRASSSVAAATTASTGLAVDFGSYDMAVMDGRAYLELDSTQKTALEESVRAGLGLMIIADSALVEATPAERAPLLSGFVIEKQDTASNSAVPVWDGNVEADLSLPVLPVSIRANGGRTIVGSSRGPSINIVQPLGLGRVSVTRLRQRSAWATAGETGLYTSYWRHILEHVSRMEQGERLIPQDSGQIPYPGQPMKACALGTKAELRIAITRPADNATADLLHLARDRAGSGLSCSNYVPTMTGWYTRQLLLPDGTVVDEDQFHVFAKTDWAGNDRWQRMLATRDRIAQATSTQGAALASSTHSLFSPLLLGLLLMIIASILWAERKIPS